MMTAAAFRDVVWATGPTVLRRIASALLLLDRPPEFGNCCRAGLDDPPADLTLAPETPAGHRLSCPHPLPSRWPAGSPFPPFMGGGEGALITMGRHSRPGLWERLTGRRPRIRGVPVTIAQVDLRTGMRHLLTPDAVAAGREGTVGYIALCGAPIVPATTGSGVKCQPCQTASAIPVQRSRKNR